MKQIDVKGSIMSIFDSLETLPDDPILGLTVAFKSDPRPNKVNLGVGAYKDADGNPMVLNCVRKAELLLIDQDLNKEYPPISGGPEFVQDELELLYGKELLSERIFGAQTLGGTGALRVGGEFIANCISNPIYLSDPSWPNHKPIFTRSGLHTETYPYYDTIHNRLDFDGMCNAIKQMPERAIILLHAGCHNPSGMDPSFEQWKELSDLIKAQRVIPFFDFAYQGFAVDPETDARPIRYFVQEGHELLVAHSFSKNFGLYGERVGALSIVTADGELSKRVGSHIKQLIRGNYSMPPLQGQRIVKTILSDAKLKEEWHHELANMRVRIQEMRKAFVSGLQAKGGDHQFQFMKHQNGMFSFSGLVPSQVTRLQKEYGIYMPQNGRINVAGINAHNLEYVIDAITTVQAQ